MNVVKRPEDLGGLVKQLMANVKEEELVLTVRRGHVLEDALRVVKRSTFDPLKTLRVYNVLSYQFMSRV